jgi:hypothetical protein
VSAEQQPTVEEEIAFIEMLQGNTQQRRWFMGIFLKQRKRRLLLNDPDIPPRTIQDEWDQLLRFYTGVQREQRAAEAQREEAP